MAGMLRLWGAVIFCLAIGIQASPGQISPTRAIKQIQVAPLSVEYRPDRIIVDFGKVWFGNVEIVPNVPNLGGSIRLRLRESSNDTPLPSTGPEPIGVRFFEADLKLDAGPQRPKLRQTPNHRADDRLVPPDIGFVMPFRYLDIIGWRGELQAESVLMHAAIASVYEERGNVRFLSGQHMDDLNAVWALSSHTMAATSFAGIFVDGDRERLPYEADAYINQLGWLAVVGEVSVPRRTFEYLLENPTWPTEWQSHMVLIAWADYMFTGDVEFLRRHYERLKVLTLHDLIDDDGWLVIRKASLEQLKLPSALENIVDWPPNQRDGNPMIEKNTVTNAFVYAALHHMAKIAGVVGVENDRRYFERMADRVKKAIQSNVRLANGCFSDGVGSSHVSAHSLFIPLAFGLVEDADRPAVLAAIKDRVQKNGGGFPGSVFSAQYLLEALFKSGQDSLALNLIINPTMRGWLNMLKKYQATITHEAWDVSLKDNEDWTHAWGSAPANIIPRYLVGIRPIDAGWRRWRLSPSTALDASVEAEVPIPGGTIKVRLDRSSRSISVNVPLGTVCECGSGSDVRYLPPGDHVISWK